MYRLGRTRPRSGAPYFFSHLPDVITMACVLGASGCLGTDEAEPVRFAAFQPELFADGGALTDAWADFDGDGDPDRFVGFNGKPSRLYRNDATGLMDRLRPRRGDCALMC